MSFIFQEACNGDGTNPDILVTIIDLFRLKRLKEVSLRN
jgi:hypothetical protein